MLLPLILFQRVHPVHLPLPFISRRSFRYFRYFLPFVSRFQSRSFTSSFRFKSFIPLPPSFRFNSSFLFVLLFLSFQLVHFIASVLSLQLFPSIRYFLRLLLQLFFIPFVTFSLSFQLFASVPSPSFLSFKTLNSSILFMYLFLSFQGARFATSFLHFNSYMQFVYLFLSFQLFFPVRLAFPFLSTRPFYCIRPFPFHSLLPSFRFKTSPPFVCLFLSFPVVHFISWFLPFQLEHPVSLQTWKTSSGCKWLLFWISTAARFATMLQFLIQALFAFLLETQENMNLMVWGLHNIPFIGNRGRHTSPSPQTHHPADLYLWVSQLAA